ncbi:MAG: aminotransferase class III-fold pyridoxal phosphate-dependent enzyme, partial [Planctomycetes bacterium]|nr:aminotransferase class III-fold pyridoxal phosphate-dependent enzyme [Planctomycetota bacterium]
DLTRRRGAVLVFDEVVSGFRVALGGAQERFGVTPDLAAIGKGVANGMPVSAIVGRADLLRLIEEGVFVSTTFGGEALSLAAALKTVEILRRPGSFEHTHGLSRTLLDKGQQLIAAKGLADVVAPSGLPGHCGFVFRKSGRVDANDLRSVFQQQLIQGGILTTGIDNFCLEHTAADVEQHLAAMGPALDDVARAVEADSVDGLLTGRRILPIFKRN